MAINRYADVRVRTDGNDSNGAFFDPFVSIGQAQRTDVECANSTTITSAGASWTSAIVDTYIFVTSNTGGWRSRYYRVTAFNSSTSITLEEKPVADGFSAINGDIYTYTNKCYNDAASPILSLTDIACSNTTTVTSATGGFTSEMVGNAIKISGGGSTTGYYIITARTDTNTVTVDKTPGTVSGGIGKVGGAALTVSAVFNSANPANEKVVTGNTIWLRGGGTDDPASPDYSPGAYITPVAGTTTQPITLKGYNGRPHIRGPGLIFYHCDYNIFENLKLSSSGTTFGSDGLLNLYSSWVENCRLDVNTQAMPCIVTDQLTARPQVIKNCDFYSGTVSPVFNSSAPGVWNKQSVMPTIIGCSFRYIRGSAIADGQTNGGGTQVYDSVFYNCAGTAIEVLSPVVNSIPTIRGNVFYGTARNGVEITQVELSQIIIENNIFANHASGSYAAINVATGQLYDNNYARPRIRNNAYYNNTNNFLLFAFGPGDIQCTADPFVSAGTDWTLNGTTGGGLELRDAGFPQTFLGFLSTAIYKSIGFLATPSGGAATPYVICS